VSANGKEVACFVETRGGKNRLLLLAADSGKPKWEQPVPDYFVLCPPIIGCSTAGFIFKSDSGQYSIAAFDIDTGKPLWVTEISADLTALALPFGHEDQVFVLSEKGEIVVLNEEDGSLRWRSGFPGKSYRPPILRGGRVIVSWRKESWEDTDSRVPQNTVGIDCFDPQSGKLLWRHKASGRGLWQFLLAVDSRHVFCGVEETESSETPSSNIRVTCFEAADGKVVWENSLPFADFLIRYDGKLIGIAGRFFAREKPGEKPDFSPFWAADAATGRLLEVTHGQHLLVANYSSPMVMGNVAALMLPKSETSGMPGELVWLDLQTGKVLAKRSLLRILPDRPPAGGDGRVYVAEIHEGIFAFEYVEGSQ
jgi:outer membrane protein assembly factor BamB